MTGERTRATGKINVKTYEPSPYDQPAEGPALFRIHVEEDFSGDIEGEGVAEFLQTSSRTREGSTVSGSWFVVPGSGTGELQGLRGEGGLSAELGQSADITLDYWFE